MENGEWRNPKGSAKLMENGALWVLRILLLVEQGYHLVGIDFLVGVWYIGISRMWFCGVNCFISPNP